MSILCEVFVIYFYTSSVSSWKQMIIVLMSLNSLKTSTEYFVIQEETNAN
jgi:hypothetical protein